MRRSRWKKPALAATACALALSGVPGVAAAEADPFAGYQNQRVDWTSCPYKLTDGAKAAQCAVITVPRDWTAPSSGHDLKVSINRVAATGEHKGMIFVNPGGPGGQGTGFASELAGLEPALNQQYDIVGMDPRGTGQEGAKDPALQPVACQVPSSRLPQGNDLDARDRSAKSIAEHQKAPRAVAEACQSDALAPYLTTWQTAHDMELIRRLLGEPKLNYLGYSYGTWLGAKYTSLFPDQAGKVVLDSSVNWQGRLQADFEDFPVIDQGQFEKMFLPWLVRQYPALVGKTLPEAKATYEKVRRYYAANGTAPDNFDQVFVGMGSKIRWLLGGLVFLVGASKESGIPLPTAVSPEVTAALDAQARGTAGVAASKLTPQQAVVAATSDYTPKGETRYAVACGDQPTRSAAWYRSLSDRQGPEYPLFGWAYGLSEPCAFWSDAPTHTLPDLPARVAGNVLVVQGEFDPQTGYDQAKAAVQAAPGVSLVSVDDSGFHGQYAISGNPCVDGMVNVFLLNNSRPGNATCPGVPIIGEDKVYPVPGPVDGQAHTAPYGVATLVGSLLRDLTQDFMSHTNKR
ncbi:alpha/beta hydrolase [Amycolatopsis pigmentata]|uniref:Alpha/beta hydrolase n=1 Tax=Amycolatopsis pigmentata TaxID=450801 RepID=A0ABW5G0N8_9PSEU